MKTKEELVKVFERTVEDLKRGFYTVPDGKSTVKFNDSKLRRDSWMYTDNELKGSIIREDRCEFKTKVYVENKDTFLKAIEMGPKAVILNMASSRNPGGGVAKGSRAQEEDLCRRSNLLVSLYSFTDKGKSWFGCGNRDFKYPIPTFGGIYSPKVTIYKDTDYNTYTTPYYTNVISVAAMIKPDFDPITLMIPKKQAYIMKRKIRSIFRVALLHGHTKLVLGAFGCGAFANPPKHVALMFKEVLEETEFNNVFEEICFAILDDNNTGKAHNPEGNYKPFVDLFGTNETI